MLVLCLCIDSKITLIFHVPDWHTNTCLKVYRVAAATATNTGLSSSLSDPIISNAMLYNNMY